MVESVLSVLLVGGVLIAALNTLGGSRKSQRHQTIQSTGQRLCQTMLDEIRGASASGTVAVNGTVPTNGSSVGILGTATVLNRTSYTSPTSYHGWSQSPPVDRWGIAIPNTTGFTRSITARMINPTDLTSTSATDQGLYEVKIAASYGGRVVASLQTIIGDTSSDPASNQEGMN